MEDNIFGHLNSNSTKSERIELSGKCPIIEINFLISSNNLEERKYCIALSTRALTNAR